MTSSPRQDILRHGRWLCAGGWHGNNSVPPQPAPFFRREFAWNGGKCAQLFLCGLGYYEVYINGQRVGEQYLDPVPSQYDKRSRYVSFDVSPYLNSGLNCLGIILGSGWYDCHTATVWGIEHASWRDYPKFNLEMTDERGRIVLLSDPSWRCTTDGPIRFEGLRNGETYDARQEFSDWSQPGFDDSAWKPAVICPGPGGVLTQQVSPPCVIFEELKPIAELPARILDFGKPISGWAQIEVSGPSGSEITLKYRDILLEDGTLSEDAGMYIKSGEFQTDHYILKGDGREIWHPRFTYHGFRYLQLLAPQEVTIHAITAQAVGTKMEAIGDLRASDDSLNRLLSCTRQSYRNNFVGIPTDCPHREKNGWTADAMMVAESAMYLYDNLAAYQDWLQDICDVQRPNGQLPGIIPTAGWGFNSNSGPAWDSALIQIPWYAWLYRGNGDLLDECYPSMVRYLDYLASIEDNGLVYSDLGDYNHPFPEKMADRRLTATAYYYLDAVTMARIADLRDLPADQRRFTRLASRIAAAFNRKFHRGKGIYGNGEPTSQAIALMFGLCPPKNQLQAARALNLAMLNCDCRANFGLIGAKFVPRALAEFGYGETALKVITQPEYPGWGHCLKLGAKTLWENWSGKGSQDHVTFGDVAAWQFRYLAGIRPQETHPGFSKLLLQPLPLGKLTRLDAEYVLPHDRTLKIHWERDDKTFSYVISCDKTTPVTLILPNGSRKYFRGTTKGSCKIP